MTSNLLSRSRLLAILAALALIVAACGDDDDGDAADGDADTETTAAEETTTTEAEAEETTTTEAEAEETTTTAAEGDDDEAAGDAIPVELGEWFVGTDDSFTAGTLSFAIDNTGENPHAFAIAVGDSYEDLPQLDNGAVDTDALGDLYLGTTEDVASGDSTTIEFDLEAGNYVFFCPIQFGPNSHAAAGQVLSVTVS